MAPKTPKPTPTPTTTTHKMFIDINELVPLGVSPKDMSPDKVQQFCEALVLAAKYCDGTRVSCCPSFIYRKDVVKLHLRDHWFYAEVEKQFLADYWDGHSFDSDQVQTLLRKAFGLFVVLSQNHEQHQVLREEELECAPETLMGIIPEYANMTNPKAQGAAKLVSFMD